MTLAEKRNLIASVYASHSWKNKVAKMNEDQVIAVYLAFDKAGKLGKDPIRRTHHEQLKIMVDAPINYKVIAVDFDGTLCEDKWPVIGEPIWKTINYIKEEQKKGNKIILWTCRAEERLDEAVEWCREKGIIFDMINDNVPEISNKFGGNSRKIYADEYIDDKAFMIW